MNINLSDTPDKQGWSPITITFTTPEEFWAFYALLLLEPWESIEDIAKRKHYVIRALETTQNAMFYDLMHSNAFHDEEIQSWRRLVFQPINSVP